MLKVAIGADHRGFDHKLVLQEGVYLEEKALEWIDVGCFNADYPIEAKEVVERIINR
jgi:ribose 5-phosphate isomerase RpiB